jgi:hypothetical protein
MSSRERRRAERQKRKQRSAARPAPEPAASTTQDPQDAAAPIEDLAAEAEAEGTAGPTLSRRELRDQEAREQLEPLEEGERPRVVTVGAIISALIALITVGAWVAGAEVSDGERPTAFQVFAPSILFAVMAYGMWQRRYWAVLGFQAIMAIIMVGAFITLIAAASAAQALTAGLALAVAGCLFWFTVKALARIQMPSREGLD